MKARESTRRLALDECRIGGGEVAAAALCSISDAVVTTDVSGRIRFLNPAAETLLECTYEDARQRPLRDLLTVVDGVTGARVEDPVNRYLRKGEGEGERFGSYDLIVHPDGREIPIEDTTSLVRNARNEIVGAVMILRDMSAAPRYVREIQYQATHDPVTALVNRREFERRLGRVLDGMTGHQVHALLLMEPEPLAAAGAQYGQDFADDLTGHCAGLLVGRVRQRDTLASLGGLRFALLLEHCPEVQAFRVAQSLRRGVAESDFRCNGEKVALRLSVGLVPLTGRRRSLHEFLSLADAACAAAKHGGGDRVHVHHRADAEFRPGGPIRSIGGGSVA